LAQSVEGIQGERCGVSTTSLGGLWIYNSRKMKFEAFIHNDDMACFHVVV
jgi:hypothetical protein